jgi:hypothetical protein
VETEAATAPPFPPPGFDSPRALAQGPPGTSSFGY